MSTSDGEWTTVVRKRPSKSKSDQNTDTQSSRPRSAPKSDQKTDAQSRRSRPRSAPKATSRPKKSDVERTDKTIAISPGKTLSVPRNDTKGQLAVTKKKRIEVIETSQSTLQPGAQAQVPGILRVDHQLLAAANQKSAQAGKSKGRRRKKKKLKNSSQAVMQARYDNELAKHAPPSGGTVFDFMVSPKDEKEPPVRRHRPSIRHSFPKLERHKLTALLRHNIRHMQDLMTLQRQNIRRMQDFMGL
eukprot:184796_1